MHEGVSTCMQAILSSCLRQTPRVFCVSTMRCVYVIVLGPSLKAFRAFPGPGNSRELLLLFSEAHSDRPPSKCCAGKRTHLHFCFFPRRVQSDPGFPLSHCRRHAGLCLMRLLARSAGRRARRTDYFGGNREGAADAEKTRD